jgi:hypothetical protein
LSAISSIARGGLVGPALFLQARFTVNGLLQRDRVCRVVGDQLAQSVHLAVGHLQHAAHVAAYRARLQLSEGDDLGNLVFAILLLHVRDHFITPVLAEVDIEVRHRHAFGIQESARTPD